MRAPGATRAGGGEGKPGGALGTRPTGRATLTSHAPLPAAASGSANGDEAAAAAATPLLQPLVVGACDSAPRRK